MVRVEIVVRVPSRISILLIFPQRRDYPIQAFPLLRASKVDPFIRCAGSRPTV